jgi:FkbH-like protein
VVKLNHLLYELASETDNLLILGGNPSSVSDILDHPLAVTADLHFSLPYIDWLGRQALGMIESRYGKMKKCVILDLDNTLWGGIIGDDGMEGIQIGSLGIGKAFTRFQKWLRELGQRGIILAVCSKNNEDIAREPFLRHPEMILRLDDISVFVANWESKSDNISRIRDILNIGLDSMVFIDDNPAEREIVRRHLPEVTVPELPEDPALYLPYLTSLNLFETATFSKDDRQRTRQYQEESKRRLLAASITNMDEFLNSLNMRGRIGPFSEVDVERISQLSLRSNQFNLRTIRYNTAEIREIMQDPACETFSVELSDKFGHYGLISIVIIRIREDDRAEIDTWIMSCRVLKRTVEHFLMNHIAERLRHRGVQLLTGEYLPTEKNGLVRELLPSLGFEPIGENTYGCDLTSYPPLNTNIQRNDHQHQ